MRSKRSSSRRNLSSQANTRHAQAQRKAEIKPHRMADDRGWEPVTGVAGTGGCCHPVRLTGPLPLRKPDNRQLDDALRTCRWFNSLPFHPPAYPGPAPGRKAGIRLHPLRPQGRRVCERDGLKGSAEYPQKRDGPAFKRELWFHRLVELGDCQQASSETFFMKIPVADPLFVL
jgi:hypothetical protein